MIFSVETVSNIYLESFIQYYPGLHIIVEVWKLALFDSFLNALLT